MKAYQQLEQKFIELDHLKQLAQLANWDEAVMMPTGAGEMRAKVMGTLMSLRHQKLISDEMANLLQAAEQESLEHAWQQRNFDLMKKRYQNATCLPETLVAKITQTNMSCEQAWRQMRAQNNWQDFKPLLQKVVDLTKESAEIRSQTFNKAPYDVLIDDHSPDLSMEIIDPIFDQLKTVLPDLIQRIVSKQQSRNIQPIVGPFAIAKQKALGLALMKTIGFNFTHGRLDVSHHPFCDGGPEDIRITTRYEENNFIPAAMGVCHETGHAMYELGLPKDWMEQPVGKATSMALHESQSLLIEMQVCRNQAFMPYFTELARQHLGDLPHLNPENLYYHYTQVTPSFIRVDADEVTYPLHVILRYEIEKQLIAGEITVNDLPAIWDEKMQRYLHLDTKNNFKEGIMQDVHWPAGLFGYFPAYTFGALIAAQLFQKACQDNTEIMPQINQGNFSLLLTWLRQHVHRFGSLYDWQTLLKKATGEQLNTRYYLDHVKRRYL